MSDWLMECVMCVCLNRVLMMLIVCWWIILCFECLRRCWCRCKRWICCWGRGSISGCIISSRASIRIEATSLLRNFLLKGVVIMCREFLCREWCCWNDGVVILIVDLGVSDVRRSMKTWIWKFWENSYFVRLTRRSTSASNAMKLCCIIKFWRILSKIKKDLE